MQRERNVRIDVLRGFAAVIVVIGHVFQRFEGATENILFNIIFSFQMPLFMMLSGFTCIYSKKVDSFIAWLRHFRKRCVSLLLPWCVWSVFAYVFLSDLDVMEYIKRTSVHMESAFWFLFSLWTIDTVFSLSRFFSESILKRRSELSKVVGMFLFVAVLFVPIIMVGMKFGITFLAIKYSLYYSIFYAFGYVLGEVFQTEIYIRLAKLRDVLVAVLLVVYAILISQFNVIEMPDDFKYIMVRIFISLCVCWIIFEVANKVDLRENRVENLLRKAGGMSLELYVVHYFTVKWLDVGDYNLNTLTGFAFAIVFFTIVLLFTSAIIAIINQSKCARFVLFGKMSK